MSTGVIVLIVVVVIVLIGLALMLPRMRARARLRARERELGQRREQAVTEHRAASDQLAEQAELAERRARIAQREAAKQRAEAELQNERAELHEEGLADDQLVAEHERERFAGTSAAPVEGDAPDREAVQVADPDAAGSAVRKPTR